MKRFSKFLSLLMAIVMVFSLCSISVFAEDSAKEPDLANDYFYKVNITTEVDTLETNHPGTKVYYSAHGYYEDGTSIPLTPHPLVENINAYPVEVGENESSCSNEMVFYSKEPLVGIRLLSESSDDQYWTFDTETDYYKSIGTHEPGVDKTLDVGQVHKIMGFKDGGEMILSESMDPVFTINYSTDPYYYKIPVTTKANTADHPDFNFNYHSWEAVAYDNSEIHVLKEGEDTVQQDVYFYSEEPLEAISVVQMSSDDLEWTFDDSEYYAEINGVGQKRGKTNAVSIEEMKLVEYDEDGNTSYSESQPVVFNVTYTKDLNYYYKIAVTKNVNMKNTLFHGEGGATFFEFIGQGSGSGASGVQTLEVLDDSNKLGLYPEETTKKFEVIFVSPYPLETISIRENDENVPDNWEFDTASYRCELDPDKQSTGLNNAVVIEKMDRWENSTDSEASALNTAVVFTNTYTLPEEEKLTYEVELTVDVEQEGTAAPGRKTLQFQIVPTRNGESPEENGNDEDIFDEDYAFTADPVTVSGAGKHTVKVRFNIPKWMQTDGTMNFFGIRQISDSDDAWDYDAATFVVEYDSTSSQHTVYEYDHANSEWVETENIGFSNTHNDSLIIVEEEDDDDSDTYTITASARAGGKISPSGEITVEEGRSKTFKITPDKGYEISRIVIDGEDLPKKKLSNTYTFKNVDEDHRIRVYFSKTAASAKDDIEETNPNTGAI